MSRRVTVRGLAAEAKLDLDEVLVMLWGVAIESVLDPDDLVPAKHTASARQCLGIRASTNLLRVEKRYGIV